MTEFDNRSRFVLCFGAQRGGTTWLSNQLRAHPECDFPYRKELRYLDAKYYHNFDQIQTKRIEEFREKLDELDPLGKEPLTASVSHELKWWCDYAFTTRDECDDAWYQGLFRYCDPEKLTGDFSPDYSLLQQSEVDHLKSILPRTVRLIFILRNPIERLWSGLTYGARHNKTITESLPRKRVLKRLDNALPNDFSDYPNIIKRFEKSFGPDSILYLFHEDLQDDPQGVLRNVCAHLDIAYDEEFFPRVGKSTNRSPSFPLEPEIREEISRRYIDRLEWLSNRFGGHAVTWLNQARLVLSETQDP